jgi:sulfur relay (sulfurtransferase) complex TusBCD TusD component (DsrE family)
MMRSWTRQHVRRSLPVRILVIVNDPRFGTERCYDAERPALALRKREPRPELTVFLMTHAVFAADREPVV